MEGRRVGDEDVYYPCRDIEVRTELSLSQSDDTALELAIMYFSSSYFNQIEPTTQQC